MAKEYLDKDGLSYFWGKIKALLNGKQNTLVSGTNIKTVNNNSLLGSGNITISGGSGGTSDYDDLTNKPSINNVTLTGNKTTSDLGISQPSSLSDLTNDKLASSLFIEEKASSGIAISSTTSGKSGSKAYTKTGYTLLGVVGYDCEGTGVTQCNVYRLYYNNSDGKVYAFIRTATSTTITVYPYLLWVKTA